MEHRPTQRWNHLAPPQSNPSPSSSTVAKHPKPTTTTTTTTHHHPTPNPDLIAQLSSRPNSNFTLQQHFSSLNLGPSHSNQSQITKHKHKQKHPSSLVDTRLQAKAMTSSAIVDSSKFSLLKPNTNNTRVSVAPKLENKESSATKRSSKEKPQRPKLQGLMKNEKKNEIEKLRNHVLAVGKHDDDDDDDGDVGKRSCSSVSMVAPPSGDGVRRRSLCGSSVVDLRDVFAINGVKMVSADMPPFMQIHAVDSARKAFDSMEKFTSKTLAFSLKKEFDGVYGPAWHCIVGTSFGSFVTHSVGGFLYFSMDQKLYILLFRTAVQKVS